MHCMQNIGTPEEKVFLESDLVQEQPGEIFNKLIVELSLFYYPSPWTILIQASNLPIKALKTRTRKGISLGSLTSFFRPSIGRFENFDRIALFFGLRTFYNRYKEWDSL